MHVNNVWRWWQTGVVYQIYPRSFQDSNGDGIGDLEGIIQRLDYLQWLGIDAIWISPIYPSPMADFGYDVANYTDIHPLFGDLATFDRLLEAAHQRDIRVILDFVPNHSSDEHPWFVESRSSRENPKRDWYIWRDPQPDGSPPNNWVSAFGGKAWAWDAHTAQYYLHLFVDKQPDLNWRNPEVVAAMHDVLRFWLDRGVDGFRMDVVTYIIKDEALRSNPLVEQPASQQEWYQQEHRYDINQPEVHAHLQAFRRIVDSYSERVIIGEVWEPDLSKWVGYYGANLDELHLPFNFSLLDKPWQAAVFQKEVDALEAALPAGAQPNFVLGSHDVSRLSTRYGAQAVRVAAMLLLTLRGTPTIYLGEELGMVDGFIPPDRIVDPQALGTGGTAYNRDACRTPFQWSGAAYAGFSTVEPWLPVAEGYQTCNVADQKDDPRSVLNLYRALLKLRAAHPALHRGSYAALPYASANCYLYERRAEGERFRVALNFGDASVEVEAAGYRIVLSTHLDRDEEPVAGRVTLRPHEGLVLRYVGEATQ